MRFVLCIAMLLAGTPVWAINKCTGTEGKVSFQDAPCAGKGEKLDVRPSSGPAKAPASGPDGKMPLTEAQRLDALTAQSQQDRRHWDLRDRLVPSARNGLAQHRARCVQTQAQLADDQYRYQQNLYGKTHAAQIASEMAAQGSKCDMKDRELKENLDKLERECAAINCTKQ